jgi:flagellar L-ring protein precursor FlgH
MRAQVFLRIAFILAAALGSGPAGGAWAADKKTPQTTALEEYLNVARQGAQPPGALTTPGSIWSPAARFYDLGADLRASRLNDIVTIVVEERAFADSQGTVTSARSSSADSSIPSLGGITSATGPFRNLLGTKSESKLEGQGGTSRRTVLTTTMTARVSEVLPNGNLVIDGEKRVMVNSETQLVTLRGVIRPYDVNVANAISSDQVALMELKVNGKGVVGDAIRRPNFFYRLLLGLLPF